MSRIAGYQVTVKLFIPAPKTDFKAQAKAAAIMDAIMSDGVLTSELVAAAKVVGVDGRFSSMEAPDVVSDVPANDETPPTPPYETQSDETAVDGVRKAGKSRG